ncbi:MAG: DUF3499 family protein [Acidimicrobiales bacterium]
MSRKCARPGCGGSAVATLSYAYSDGVVWLEDLAPEAHPMVHDMCRMHAETVRVPRGWELRDERDRDVIVIDDPTARHEARAYDRVGEVGLGLVGA